MKTPRVLIVFLFFLINFCLSAQDFDYSTLPGMDVYSRADIVSTDSYGDVDINALNKLEGVNSEGISRRRAEKINLLNQVKDIDAIDDIQYANGVFECGSFAFFTAANLSGVNNLEESDYYNNFSDYYKEKITNGKFNAMPIYRVATVAGGSENPDGTRAAAGGHWINAAFVGPKNPNEEDNPAIFKQWYFWEPQTDKEVVPGDFSMNKDGDVNIYWFGEIPNFFTGEWSHSDVQILGFDLDFGFGGIHKYLVMGNPHRTNPEFEEMGDQIVNAHNGETAKTPGMNSDSEHYTPTVKVVKGEKTFTIGPDYPEYFEQVSEYYLGMPMGRWNASNLSNLGDTLEVKTTYADIVKPTVIAPADVTAGHNADMGVERMGEPVVNDDSPYPLTTSFSDEVIRDDASYKVVERTWSASDVSGNASDVTASSIQTITRDQNVGVNELSATKSFDLDQNYPNPVTSSTTIPYFVTEPGYVTFEIWNIDGTLLNKKNEYTEKLGIHSFQLDMSDYSAGIYLFKGINAAGNFESIQIIKQ